MFETTMLSQIFINKNTPSLHLHRILIKVPEFRKKNTYFYEFYKQIFVIISARTLSLIAMFVSRTIKLDN